jgi:hypothetical protein
MILPSVFEIERLQASHEQTSSHTQRKVQVRCRKAPVALDQIKLKSNVNQPSRYPY